MAQMIERQLTHRAAARSVSGMAAVLAHEIKNPLSGIRGAAQLLEPGLKDEDRALTQLICTETDRIRNLVDRMEVFGDERPLGAEPVNIHSVLDHVKRLAETGFADGITDQRRLRSVAAARAGQPRQAHPGLPQPRQECRRGHRREAREPGRIVLRTAFRPGVRLAVPGTGARVSLPLMIEVEDNGPGVRRGAQAAPVRSVRDDQAQGHRPRAGAGCQDHRRPRRRHRVRVRCPSARCFACCCRCRSSSHAGQIRKHRAHGWRNDPDRR